MINHNAIRNIIQIYACMYIIMIFSAQHNRVKEIAGTEDDKVLSVY